MGKAVSVTWVVAAIAAAGALFFAGPSRQSGDAHTRSQPVVAEPRPEVELPQHAVSIILISIDTLRADVLGSYGYRKFPTSPVLDAFAAENIQFENAFVQEPRTLTSHMSLLTGLYVQNHTVQDKTSLPDDIPTLAMHLKASGYATQAYVDNGWLKRRWGFGRGFDGYVDEKVGLERSVTAGIEWLEEHRDVLFFLFLHTYDVHTKGGGYPRYAARGKARGIFSRGIESAFDVETADEFERVWNHDNLYHETIHVPLLVRIPGVRGGGRVQSVVESVDLAPTLLDLAHFAGTSAMDGNSLLPLLEQEGPLDYAYTIRVKKDERIFSVHDGRHHYFWDGVTDSSHFFDLQSDPLELNNLQGSGTRDELRLKQQLFRWVKEYDRKRDETALADRPLLDDAISEKLRALGYLQ